MGKDVYCWDCIHCGVGDYVDFSGNLRKGVFCKGWRVIYTLSYQNPVYCCGSPAEKNMDNRCRDYQRDGP